MAIKWSALKVKQAMDEVDEQLGLAEAFLNRAADRVKEAKSTPNLSGYMEERLGRLEEILREGLNRFNSGVESVRKAIPKDALEAERKSASYGSKPTLMD